MKQEDKQKRIKKILQTQFSELTCDECKWQNEGKEDSEKQYYCDDCPGCRFLGWRVSDKIAENIAKHIVTIVNDKNKIIL